MDDKCGPRRMRSQRCRCRDRSDVGNFVTVGSACEEAPTIVSMTNTIRGG
jgi:hypothetical protein